MKVFINSIVHDFQEPCLLSEAVKSIGYENTKGIALAVNNKVAPKTTWETHQLKEADKITIIKATQGG